MLYRTKRRNSGVLRCDPLSKAQSGHAAGDEVLRRVAERLVAACGADYFPARIGGDEFVIVTPVGKADERLAEFIQTLLRDLRIHVGDTIGSPVVTASIRHAWSRTADHRREALLRLADTALYDVKRREGGISYQGGR